MTPTQISAALDENAMAPYGSARTAEAERLAEMAGQTADRALLIRALQEQIQAQEYDGGGARMLVPFARVLRMWDEGPADFDRGARYRLHWHFKWASGGMIWHSTVALATIERWLDEMQARYRQSGYGLHAVLSQRYQLAEHLGDTTAAERIFDEWTTTARDAMSDCHACDLGTQGRRHDLCGRDAEALRVWQPVLAGELSCAEEPHRILAKSLLPLARLGRLDEARANHLRGYRMARGVANLRPTVGLHIEFAALTGNEARGLEILAEHAGWLSLRDESVAGRMSFLEAVGVLMRRLGELGYGDILIPRGDGPATAAGELREAVEREVLEIAARFDERNGNTAVSDRARARLGQLPIVAALVLGLKATALAATRVPERAGAGMPVEPAVACDHDSLVDAAVRLNGQHHPSAAAAWERVAASGDLSPIVAAQVAESRALSRARRAPGTAFALFTDVAQRFAAAGDAAGAAMNGARAGLAAVVAGARGAPATDGVGQTLSALAELRELFAAGQASQRHVAVAWLCAVKAMFVRSLGEPDNQAEGRLEAELTEMAASSRAGGRLYELAEVLVVQAQLRLREGEHDQARELLDEATQHYLTAGTPWRTAEPLSLLARLALGLGDPASAERHIAVAQEHGADLLNASELGHLTWLRAQACFEQGGRDGEVVGTALAAAHQFDGVEPEAAMKARLLAASAFHRDGRLAEAAAIFETALPDARAAGDEAALVRALRGYGLCLTGLGEPREAARTLLEAAALAQAWPDQNAHASLAHDGAAALEAAGLAEEAERTYARAGQLWGQLGNTSPRIRAIRAQAWVRTRRAGGDWPAALALMADAAALSPVGSDADLTYERYQTQLQTAQLFLAWLDAAEAGDARSGGEDDQPTPPETAAEDGLGAASAAADGFGGIDDLRALTRAHVTAAMFEARHLGRADDAVRRLRQTRQLCLDRGETSLAGWCGFELDELEQWD